MTDDLSTPRDNYSQIYEIVIGGWSNTKSCIRPLKETCASTASSEILSIADYVQLWISWDNNKIRLGKGLKADGVEVVSYPQNIPYDVNYLAVMTHYTSSWRFYEGWLLNLVKILKIIYFKNYKNAYISFPTCFYLNTGTSKILRLNLPK